MRQYKGLARNSKHRLQRPVANTWSKQSDQTAESLENDLVPFGVCNKTVPRHARVDTSVSPCSMKKGGFAFR